MKFVGDDGTEKLMLVAGSLAHAKRRVSSAQEVLSKAKADLKGIREGAKSLGFDPKELETALRFRDDPQEMADLFREQAVSNERAALYADRIRGSNVGLDAYVERAARAVGGALLAEASKLKEPADDRDDDGQAPAPVRLRSNVVTLRQVQDAEADPAPVPLTGDAAEAAADLVAARVRFRELADAAERGDGLAADALPMSAAALLSAAYRCPVKKSDPDVAAARAVLAEQEAARLVDDAPADDEDDGDQVDDLAEAGADDDDPFGLEPVGGAA